MERMTSLFLPVVCLLMLCACTANARTMLLLKDDFPDSSREFYNRLKLDLTSAGYAVEDVDCDGLAGRLAKTEGCGNIIILPNARYFPVDSVQAFLEFLKRGNHFVAVSGPMFENAAIKTGGKWVTKAEAIAGPDPLKGRMFIDFSKQDLSKWQKGGSPGNDSSYTVGISGRRDLPSALNMDVSHLEGWEMYNSPSLRGSFPAESKAIAFYMTSASDTDIGVQCQEEDGTRWIANIKLPKGTKRFVLTESDFNLWRDRVAPGRGGAKDHAFLSKIESLSFIISKDNDKSSVRSIRVSDIQAVDDGGIFSFIAPVIESISPAYKVYRTHAAKGRIGEGDPFPVNAEVVSPNLRSRGLGSDAVRKWRFIPVMEVFDSGGDRLGTGAHIFLNTTQDYIGSTWGYVGLAQDTLERDPARYASMVTTMIGRIVRGIFLTNAGMDRFGYADGEKATYGSYLTNLGNAQADLQVSFKVRTLKGKVVDIADAKVNLAVNAPNSPLYLKGKSVALAAGEYRITTILTANGETIDEISHPFQVIQYHRLTKGERVTARNGNFYVHGKVWHGIGINYWPGSSSGFENLDLYADHWLDPYQYDPEIIERDMTLANKLGINLFSVQYLFTRQAPAFMDFLARAEKHGIKVNCFVDGLHPLGMNMMGPPSDWKDHSIGIELIKAAHLDGAPAVFGYDVGWEAHLGHDTDRNAYNKAWQDWVIDRYGSIEAAEKDWNFKPERMDGTLSGPADIQITTEGPWKGYVAAYRRFWDDRISEGYRAVRGSIKAVDPNHLVGARSGYGGTGSLGITARFPFDLASGAKHLDFISPEAYSLSGGRKDFLQGGLNVAYGRFVSGGKPIYWAEFGAPILLGVNIPDYNHLKSPENSKQQTEFARNMMQLCCETYSNAASGWWWPGGYRISENSDFGFINPDGTPRGAALEMKNAAKRINRLGAIPEPDAFITIDRDQSTLGYSAIYRDYASKYADLAISGKFPGIRTNGTGTTSANTPLVAVGNTSCTGQNPPKYLNAEFNIVKINGTPVVDDEVIEVEVGKPVYVEGSIGNTAEAKWVAPNGGGMGEVYLLAVSGDRRQLLPIDHDTPFLGDAVVRRSLLVDRMGTETAFTLKMIAKDRVEFGEVMRFTLRTGKR